MGQLKGVGRKRECSPFHHEVWKSRAFGITASHEKVGEFSVIANVLPLSSRDIAPFVSCVVDMQHKKCHRTLQTQSSVSTPTMRFGPTAAITLTGGPGLFILQGQPRLCVGE